LTSGNGARTSGSLASSGINSGAGLSNII
jgi:hypothetical protein